MITISKKIIIMLYSKLRILNTNELDENRVDFNPICSIRQQWLSILFKPITIMFWIVIIGYNRDTSINHKGAIQNLLRKVKSLIEIKCQKNEFLSFREQKKWKYRVFCCWTSLVQIVRLPDQEMRTISCMRIWICI